MIATSPVDGAVNVSVSGRITIQFSQTMNSSSVEDALRVAHGTSLWTRANGTFAWSSDSVPNDTVSYNPSENWPVAANVTVTLNASIAQDLLGQYLDGDADNTSDLSPADDVAWSFSVEPMDGTPPSVIAVFPMAGASVVPETTDIRFDFSEAMNRESVQDAFALVSPVRTWTKLDGTFSWTSSDRATYTPSANLEFETAYAIRLTASASDENGNVLDGDGDEVAGDDFLSIFTTRPEPDRVPPTVVTTFPLNGATNVPRTPTISITFDDAMDQNPTVAAISMARLDNTSALVAIGPFEWSGADHTVSFPVAETLSWDTLYRVSIGEAAHDDAGLSLAPPFSFAFRTAKWAGRVLGIVLEGTRPVTGASVTLGTWTTQTDEAGAFLFEGVRAGSYTITVAKAGYETTRSSRTLGHWNTTDAGGQEIDLGVVALRRSDLISPVAAAAAVGAVLAGLFALGFLLRRRRRGSMGFDDLVPEEAELER